MIRPATGGVQTSHALLAVSPRCECRQAGRVRYASTSYPRGTRGSDVVSDAPGASPVDISCLRFRRDIVNTCGWAVIWLPTTVLFFGKRLFSKRRSWRRSHDKDRVRGGLALEGLQG